MATRYYLPASGAADVSPTADAAWGASSEISLAMAVQKAGTSASDLTANSTGAANENVMVVQYVSVGLPPQTVSGTVKGQAWCREGTSTLDAMSQLVIRVVSNDGTVVRGTLLAAHSEALSSEWGAGAAARSRKFPLAAISPATLTPVALQDGDRIVIELGARVTAAVSAEVRIRAHDNLSTDLPEDETTNDVADPWVEFSHDFAFPAATTHAGAGAISAGLGVGL